MSEHGTRSGYVEGCRCRLCKDANARYQREYMAAHRQRNRGRTNVAQLPATDPSVLASLRPPGGWGSYTVGDTTTVQAVLRQNAAEAVRS